MPATVRGANVFCPSRALTGLYHQGYNHEDLLEASQEVTASQEKPEEDTVGEFSDDAPLLVGGAVCLCSVHLSSVQRVSATPTPFLWAASAASRKRERAFSQTPPPSLKKIKSTGADAIKGLTQSISRFGDNICQVLAMDPSLRTPHRRKEALKLAQQEEWLTKGDRLIFYSVLEKDINAVDAYASIDRDDQEFCEMWVRDKVDTEKARRVI
jgi:hypothetical protein